MSVVDAVVDAKGTRAQAERYLSFLFEDAAQEVAAKHYFRPTSEAVLAKNKESFSAIEQFGVETLGGWAAAHLKHFADGGTFDQVYQT